MNENNRKTKNFNLEKILLIVFWGAIIISIIFSLAIGIMGIIAFKKNGFYPEFANIFKALKGTGVNSIYSSMDEASNSFEYMTNILGVIGVAFLINFVIATILNFSDSPVKAIISIIATVAMVITSIIQQSSKLSSKYDMVIGFISVALCIILFLCFRRTAGGRIIWITFIAFMIHAVAFPIIMWLIGLGISKILSGLALLLIGGAVLIGLLYSPGGSSSPSGGGSSSGGGISKSQSQIDALNRKIKANEKGISEHRKGSLNYGFVDEKVAQKEIDSARKEIRRLEDQQNKK